MAVEKFSISLAPEIVGMLDFVAEKRFPGLKLNRSQMISFCISQVYYKALAVYYDDVEDE